MLSRRSAPPPPVPTTSTNPFSSYAAITELEKYKLISNIGKGSFGVISKVQRVEDGREFALKQLDYAKMTEKDVKQIIAEVAILESLKHRNIVQLVQKIHDPRNERIYIVMEFCTSGDLGTLIRKAKRSNTPISEDKIWNIFVQIVSALHHCHYPNERTQNGNGPGGKMGPGMRVTGDREARYQVLHRDLKPENVFLSDEFVKLGDFGLSKDMGNAMFTQTYVGTPLYMPPEILAENKYDTKSDIWSLGCLVFEMCALESPFSNAQTQAELITMVRSGRLPPIPAMYSPSLRSIVKSMLQIVPSKRPSTHDLLGMEEMKLHKKLITVQNQSALLLSKKEELRAYEESLYRKMAQLEERESYLSAREAELVGREEACRTKEDEAGETQKRLNMAAEALRAQWEKLREEKAGISGPQSTQEQLATRRPSMPPQRPPLEERATMPIPSASRPPRPAHTLSYDDTPSKIPVPIYSTPSFFRAPSGTQGSLRRAASKSLGNLAARAQAEAAADAERALSSTHGETDATPAKQVLRGHPRGRSSISSPDDLKMNNGYWNEDVSMASPAISTASPFVPLAFGGRRKSIGLVRGGSSAGCIPIGGIKPSGSSSSQESTSTAGSENNNPLGTYASSSSSAGSAFSATLPTPVKWSPEDPDLPSPFLRRMPTAPPSYTAPTTTSSRDRLPLGMINPQPTSTTSTTAVVGGQGKKGPVSIPRSKSGNLHQHVLKQNATQTMNGDKRAGSGVTGEGTVGRVQSRQMRGQ